MNELKSFLVVCGWVAVCLGAIYYEVIQRALLVLLLAGGFGICWVLIHDVLYGED